MGRGFNVHEYTAHGPPAVLISHAFWLRSYGGNPDAIGQPIRVRGKTYTVVGVLPPGFRALSRADIVRPMASNTMAEDRNAVYTAVVRLDGSRTATEVAAQATALVHAAMKSGKHTAGQLQKLDAHRIRAYTPREIVNRNNSSNVVGMVGTPGKLLWLVALLNIINLMVMRAVASAHAQAVRGSLGATGLRLALPVLAEGLLVGVLGSVVGVGLGWAGAILVQHVVSLPVLAHVRLHLGVSTCLWAIGVGVAVSLLGAWLGQRYARRVHAMDELREGARSGTGRRAGRLARGLVVAQVVLATIALMATAMVAHGMVATATGSTGLDNNDVLVFDTRPPATQLVRPGMVVTLAKRLRARLGAIPGVEMATIASSLPLRSTDSLSGIKQDDGSVLMTHLRGVDDGYFHAFGMPLLAGRAFTPADLASSAKVVIINRHLAMQQFHGHALGHYLGTGADAMRVVGVVGNLGASAAHLYTHNQIYIPRTQYAKARTRKHAWAVAVRVHGVPDRYRDSVRAAMDAVVPQWPVANMRTMQQAINDASWLAHTALTLVGLLAGLMLLLAAAGQYAVMMSSVMAREREFGIRMALGASPVRIMHWIMGVGMRRVVLGLVVGVACGVTVCLLLRSLFVALGRSAIDPWAIAVTCIVMTGAGLLACVVPALRAASVPPMHALRGE